MWKRIKHFLYNLDRAFASLIWGSAQETISSEEGRHAPNGVVCRVISLFRDHHCEKAVEHADRLNKADGSSN